MPAEGNKTLLSIIELGGYPDFRSLYKGHGYQVIVESSTRKALAALKKNKIDEELLNTFYYIIDNCEYARFSPEHESTEMHKLYNDAIKTIIKLQQKLK